LSGREATSSWTITPEQEFEFVNRELDRYWELWRHLDGGALGFGVPLLTVAATFVPASLLILGTTVDSRTFYLACIPVLVVFALLGTGIAVRVMHVSMSKSACLTRIDLLRTYLTDRSETLIACSRDESTSKEPQR
jgi:hypothetical protein